MDNDGKRGAPELAPEPHRPQMGWRNSFQGEIMVSMRSRPSCTASDRRISIATDQQSAKDTVKKHPSGDEHSNGRRRHHINSSFHQYRFVVALLAGLSCGAMLLLRYSMTISILQMVNQTHLYLEDHPNKTMQDFYDEGLVPGGEFLWNNEIVAIILGWYMFSYTLPQTFASKFNSSVGCRFAVPMGLSLCSVSNLLIPTCAYMSWHWVVACRLLNGLGAAGSLPAMITLLEDWMPYDELSLGLTTSTLVFSAVCSFCPLVAGYLTAIHWSMAFYVPSCAVLVFCALWIVLVTNRPETNWLVSERELNYIIGRDHPEQSQQGELKGESKKPQAAAIANDATNEDVYKPDSWLQLFGLPSMYAYTIVWIVDCASCSGFSFILPTYMRQVLKIPVSENGLYCFLIQMGSVLAIAWPHKFLRCLLSTGMSLTRARIYSQFACSFAMGGTFIFVGFYHRYQLPMFFLNRCFMSGDVILTGSVMSNFAKGGISSLVFAMINTLGNLSLTGVSPLIGWWLDLTASSLWGWKVIFCSMGLSQLLISIIFALFIDSDPIKFKKKANNKNESEPQAQRIAE